MFYKQSFNPHANQRSTCAAHQLNYSSITQLFQHCKLSAIRSAPRPTPADAVTSTVNMTASQGPTLTAAYIEPQQHVQYKDRRHTITTGTK